ncbi:MAG: response regulator [Eubacteriales bacterium]|nr:response regulator [Eubacteriales bacterium]
MVRKELNVMIVDDEAIARRDIKMLFDWETHNFHIVAEAVNGQDALEKFRRYPIDIMIVDIEMPVMNGLELAEKVLDESKNVKFIFLTAHSSFEFARASMRLGVDSYILKHEIDEGILMEELERLRAEMQETAQQYFYRKKESIAVLLESFHTQEECIAIMEREQIKFCPGAAYIVLIELRKELLQQMERRMIETTILHESNHSGFAGYETFSLEENHIGVLIAVDQTVVQDIELAAVDFANRIQEQLGDLLNKNLFVFVSRRIMKEQELPAIYLEMKEFTQSSWFYRDPAVLRYCDPYMEKEEHEKEAAQLYESITNHQYGEAKQCLDQLFYEEFPRKKDKRSVDQFLAKVTECLAKAWNNMYKGEAYIPAVELHRDILNTPNIFAAGKKLEDFVTELQKIDSEKSKERINLIKNYVDKHYTEDISLEALGKLIGVSEAYMSQFFKQQTGITFKAYIRNLRMEKAKEMLLSGSVKIHDIGTKLGYSSTPYFCLVFKHYFGETPTEFIRRHTDEGKNQ